MTTTAQPFSPTLTPNAARRATKLLVAVHGIGDQTAYETVQSVAVQVGRHLGHPLAMPLGRFYPVPAGTGAQVSASPILLRAPDDPQPLHDIGLAEAYWASIPRSIVTQKFVLEETKKWARSIAGRLAYQQGVPSGASARSAERLFVVLDELIESIRLLERLSFLAEKAGVFRFDLGKLLADFVGDVQVVADFAAYRDQILARFNDTVKQALDVAPQDSSREIYVVAHSEGSVIAFIALLTALSDPDAYPWITCVRGLMTIGSPIEIHHLLWPHLWREAKLQPATSKLLVPSLARPGESEPFRIPWHNYLDHGDPIAYELTCTEDWLKTTGFSKHLRPSNHEFSRYYLPGKAHVDYWTDAEVFSHFLEDVADIPPASAAKHHEASAVSPAGSARAPLDPASTGVMTRDPVSGQRALSAEATGDRASGERGSGAARPSAPLPVGKCFSHAEDSPKCKAVYTRPGAKLVAWFLPWLLVSALFFLGVYAVENAVAVVAGSGLAPLRVAEDVVAFGILIGGVTAAARLPRINDHRGWWLGGALILAAAIAIFAWGPFPDTRAGLDVAFGDRKYPEALVAGMAIAIAGISAIASRLFPRKGHLVLPILGLVAAGFIVDRVLEVAAVRAGAGKTAAELWPLAIGAAFYFYLWWLAALLFDLSFIWQRYVRGSVLRSHLQASRDRGVLR